MLKFLPPGLKEVRKWTNLNLVIPFQGEIDEKQLESALHQNEKCQLSLLEDVHNRETTSCIQSEKNMCVQIYLDTHTCTDSVFITHGLCIRKFTTDYNWFVAAQPILIPKVLWRPFSNNWLAAKTGVTQAHIPS